MSKGILVWQNRLLFMISIYILVSFVSILVDGT